MSDTTTTAAQLAPVLDQLGTVVASAGGPGPTPCTEFTVDDLVRHVVDWLSIFAGGYADPDGRAPSQDDLDRAGAPHERVRAAATTLLDAVRAGAADRPLWLGASQMPGAMALRMILWEYQVHGWDLARATGQAWRPADDGLLASLEFAPAMLTADFQGPGKAFGPPVVVPDTADPLDRLVALSGRDPHWSSTV